MMSVSSPRALLLSFVVAIFASLVIGSIYSWLGDKVWAYCVGTVLFIIGIMVLVVGLLGALEPKDGWATRRKAQGRRSVAAKVTREHPELNEATPAQLGTWGALVGLPLVALAILAFSVSAT